MTMYQAVLFDLDGTLADTAPDLGGALNRVLVAYGKQALPIEVIRPHASQGVRGLLNTGFGITPDDEAYPQLAREVLAEYSAHICESTHLFDGMADLLDTLESCGIPWGIVTNKHARFTIPLVEALGLAERAACVVSGDTTPHSKPAPDPLLFAAVAIEIPPTACIYVGDDKRDIIAANAATMRAVAARWGYLGTEAPIETWGAHRIVESPMQVLDCLTTQDII